MRTMLRAVAAVFTVALVVAGGRADEEKLPLDKLPKAVSEAVKKRFPKAELVEAAKETSKDGDKEKVEYEVTIKDGETKIDVMLTPDGKITLIEKEIAAKDLPKAVTDALDAKYPKATLKVVEEVIKVTDGKEALDFYEVLLVTAEKKTFEVKLTAGGKITETEEKKEEKKDKK
jgi:hypothetical protein